jgi:glutaredoxin-related protein
MEQGGTLVDQFVGTPDRTFVKALEKHLLGHAYVPLSKTDLPPAHVSPTVDIEQKVSEKQETEEELKARMHGLMNQSKIVLFMKGSPKKPYCQFSRKMVTMLKENNITEYSYFDILKDQSVREGTLVIYLLQSRLV